MTEAADARELVEAQAAERDDEFFPLNKLPNDVLVSVFAAIEDPNWVRRTFPLVCKDWAALYRTQDASPLHETLEVDFEKEIDVEVAAREREGRRDPAKKHPVVEIIRAMTWARARGGSVRKLVVKGGRFRGTLHGEEAAFGAAWPGAMLSIVGPSLTDISMSFGDVCKRPFWETLRTSVIPSGRLRSFAVEGNVAFDSFGPSLEALGQLSGSLEELELTNVFEGRGDDDDFGGPPPRALPRFPTAFLALENLRRLALVGHPRIKAIPAGISSLKKLEVLNLNGCDLSSLPKELGELSKLTKLELAGNARLGTTPAAEAFPAELGNLKSLRVLNLSDCPLRTVPSFVFELKSLDFLSLNGCKLSSLPKELGELSGLTVLDVAGNERLGTLPAQLGKMQSLQILNLGGCPLRTVPAFVGKMKSLEILILAYCGLSSLPKELGELSALTTLYVYSNPNLGAEAFPAELGKIKSLRDLNLSGCRLGTVPAFVGEQKSLESLNLSHCHISSLPKELGELSKLTKLELDGNKQLGTAVEAFPAELGKLKSLRVVDLTDCGLSAVPAFVFEQKSLEVLNLERCALSSLPKELGELTALKKLDVSYNGRLWTAPESEALPAELGNLKSLEEFNISGLRSVPAFVGRLQSLVNMRFHFATGAVIDAPLDFMLEGCPRLREVCLFNPGGWTPGSMVHLRAFKAKLYAQNPRAHVSPWAEDSPFSFLR